jgi:cAMP-binding proteins - catabolite gene activator and regulatory subunit of cAMP-dependent protein kinases
MQAIFENITQFAILSEQLKNELEKWSEKKEASKGDLLLEQGKICRYLYFLEKGFARGFYYHDGKDITSWFAFENDIVTSMYSFIRQRPGIENIEILETSQLYCISYVHLQRLYKEYPEFNLIGRLITEKYYIQLESRLFSLQYLPAKERYKKLLEEKPQLLQRASLGHIASYLGISQETLSRIRAKF